MVETRAATIPGSSYVGDHGHSGNDWRGVGSLWVCNSPLTGWGLQGGGFGLGVRTLVPVEGQLTNRITNKQRMYALLAAGEFGNTIPQYFSFADWYASADSRRYPYWGVRTMTPGGPCRLNCPTAEVGATAREYTAAGHSVNISCMINCVVTATLWADVYDSPTGLLVYGIEYPPRGGSWRAEMPVRGKQWEGIAALALLRRHLNASSMADLEALRERYPGHVYELSACDRCFGTHFGRNAVLWEVRCGSGEYEAATWGCVG